MSIEKFVKRIFPRQRITLVDSDRDFIAGREGISGPREFFNEDKTKKIVFDYWRKGDNFRQLNVALEIKIADGWATLMKAMGRWEGGSEKLYGIELDAISKETKGATLAIYWYDCQTGGKRRLSGMWVYFANSEEIKKRAAELGFLSEGSLPEYIDFETTARLFLQQARSLDFSTLPRLVPKSLLS